LLNKFVKSTFTLIVLMFVFLNHTSTKENFKEFY